MLWADLEDMLDGDEEADASFGHVQHRELKVILEEPRRAAHHRGMATVSKVKAISQDEVDEYVQRDSQLKLLTKAHEAQKGDLKERLLEGAKCPLRGPYLLEITEQQRSTINWKQETQLLLEEALGVDEGREKLAEMEAEAPRDTVYQMAVKRNLKYAAAS